VKERQKDPVGMKTTIVTIARGTEIAAEIETDVIEVMTETEDDIIKNFPIFYFK
jgi:hypothetical protein